MQLPRAMVVVLVASLSGCACEEEPPPPDIPEGKGRMLGKLTVFQGAGPQRAPLRPSLRAFLRAHPEALERVGRVLSPTARPLPARGPAAVIPGDVIVRFEERLGAKEALRRTAVAGLTATHGGFASEHLHLVRYSKKTGAALSVGETQELAARLGRLPGVRFTETNAMLHALAVPNDNLYTAQWHYPKMNLPAAWDVTTGDAATVVAVVDTGIVSHPDLDARVLPGIDMVSDPANAGDGDGRDDNPNDEGGDEPNGGSSLHGTHVAGTVGASTDNTTGVAGVNWRARVLPVRVLGKGGGSNFDIAAGMNWAAGGAVPGVRANPTPASVVNASLGGENPVSATFQDIIDPNVARGVVFVVAAGNSNIDASRFTPCNQQNVICVGATRFNGTRASYSNFGARIDVMGPGGELAEDANGDGRPDGVLSTMRNAQGQMVYSFENGTSMASPHVAGLVSLMKARSASLTHAQALNILKTTANPDSKCNEGCGAGLVNAHAAVLAVTGQQPTGAPKLVASASDLFFTAAAPSQSVSVTNVGGGDLTVRPALAGPEAGRLSLADGQSKVLGPGASGSFTVQASFSGLAPGSYSAELQLTSNGGNHVVNLKLKVVDAAAQKDAVVALVFQDAQGAWQAGGGGDAKAAGGYQFSVDALPGKYYVVAAVDSNGNGTFFENGEPAGMYPNDDAPEQVEVVAGQAVAGVDFVLSPAKAVSEGEARVIGTACADSSTCGAGGACVTGFPAGYCTKVCTTEPCPLGARCTDVGLDDRFCLSACDGPGAGQSTCRASYVCYDDGTGGGVCLPACTTDADCAPSTCNTGTGYCQG